MATNRANDLRAFKGFIDQQLADGATEMSLEVALDRWQYENMSEREREETTRAIRDGLDDLEAGRTRAFEELDREFRERHGLAPRS